LGSRGLLRVAVAQALKALFRLLGSRAPHPAEKPLRDELLSIERLEERARALAAGFTLDPNPRRAARNVLPRFEDNARVLRETYITLDVNVKYFSHPCGKDISQEHGKDISHPCGKQISHPSSE